MSCIPLFSFLVPSQTHCLLLSTRSGPLKHNKKLLYFIRIRLILLRELLWSFEVQFKLASRIESALQIIFVRILKSTFNSTYCSPSITYPNSWFLQRELKNIGCILWVVWDLSLTFIFDCISINASSFIFCHTASFMAASVVSKYIMFGIPISLHK